MTLDISSGSFFRKTLNSSLKLFSHSFSRNYSPLARFQSRSLPRARLVFLVTNRILLFNKMSISRGIVSMKMSETITTSVSEKCNCDGQRHQEDSTKYFIQRKFILLSTSLRCKHAILDYLSHIKYNKKLTRS